MGKVMVEQSMSTGGADGGIDSFANASWPCGAGADSSWPIADKVVLRFDGTPLCERWQPVGATLDYTEALGDFSDFTAHVPVVSARALQLLPSLIAPPCAKTLQGMMRRLGDLRDYFSRTNLCPGLW